MSLLEKVVISWILNIRVLALQGRDPRLLALASRGPHGGLSDLQVS